MSRQLLRSLHLGRILPDIDPILANQVDEKVLHPKKIPGRRNIGFTDLPALLEFAALKKIKCFTDKKFRRDIIDLNKTIYDLKLPDSDETLFLKKADIKTELDLRDKLKKQTEYDPTEPQIHEDVDIARYELNKLIEGTLEDRRRDWHYYEYDEYASALYMAVRLPANFACSKTVMNEIKAADPSYEPRSVLDFGSGMGTTIWAVNKTWPNSVSEFLNIDLSKEQQSLCEFLLRGGKYSAEVLPGVFHKQYLPTSTKSKYDMVVSAFSLLELPNAELRANIIENLWQKTDDLLVLIERGNIGGFTALNEARSLVLDLGGRQVTSRINKTYDTRVKPSLAPQLSHCVAPCPHEFICPRMSMPSKGRLHYCRFRIAFNTLHIGERKPVTVKEEFSYVVLRRGQQKQAYYRFEEHLNLKWPRIVEGRKKAGGQITFKMCTPSGDLAETTITKKYGKAVFEVAKACDWGDVLPIKANDTYVSKQRPLSANVIDDK